MTYRVVLEHVDLMVSAGTKEGRNVCGQLTMYSRSMKGLQVSRRSHNSQ